MTSTPEPAFNVGSWSANGDLATLRAAYADFHPQVRANLAACPDVHKRALVKRDPLPTRVEGNFALLDDACHPMTPYLGQDASTLTEDGALPVTSPSCHSAWMKWISTDCMTRCGSVGRRASPARPASSKPQPRTPS